MSRLILLKCLIEGILHREEHSCAEIQIHNKCEVFQELSILSMLNMTGEAGSGHHIRKALN